LKFALAFMVLLALGLTGFAAATHESTTEEHLVPGTTIVVPDRTITDTDPLPHPVTVTETVYVTVTAPPPPPEPPPPPPPPPPGGTVVERTTGTLVCNQPLASYGPLPVTFSTRIPGGSDSLNGDVRLMAGCTGDGNPATTDLILDINGNGGTLGSGDDGLVLIGVHDLQIEGHIDCGRPLGGAHQDGVQMNSAHRLTFRGVTSGNVLASQPENWVPTCHGAGGIFYVSELNDNDANLTSVVCDGCHMAGSTTGTVGTGLSIYGSTDSGARNSTFAARRPCFVQSSSASNGPTRPVNINNTCVTTS
jgi:hypothetical protein